jgi:hypothetical protein
VRKGVEEQRLRTEIERLIGTPPKILSDEDAAALQTIGIDAGAVLARIEQSFGADALTPACSRPRRGLLGRRRVSTRFTRRAKKVLELSLREAVWLHHSYIGAEHLLLGLLREGGSLTVEILTRAGLSRDELRRATLAALNKAAASASAALSRHCRGMRQADNGLGGADRSDSAPISQPGNEIIDDRLQLHGVGSELAAGRE